MSNTAIETGESDARWETTDAERDHWFARSVPSGDLFAKYTPRLQEIALPVPHYCMPRIASFHVSRYWMEILRRHYVYIIKRPTEKNGNLRSTDVYC